VPDSLSSLMASDNSSALRATNISLHLSLANSLASCNPSPRDPPVNNTTFPSNLCFAEREAIFLAMPRAAAVAAKLQIRPLCAIRFQHHFDAPIFLIAEGLVHLRRIVNADDMGNYKGRIDFTTFNLAQERV
jgi:hypothetical protein